MRRRFCRLLMCAVLVVLMCLNRLDDLCVVHAKTPELSAQKTNEFGNDLGSVSFQHDEVTIDFNLNGNWNSGHNITVVIHNDSEIDSIENWQLDFDYPVSISNIWNANINSSENNHYVVKNCGWNKDIGAQESVTFGFSCNDAFDGFPVDCRLHDGSRSKLDFDSFKVSISNSWDNGCTGTIVINNTSDHRIEDWMVEFDCYGIVESVWDGRVVANNGNHYTVKNAGYNYAIEAGASASFGFLISGKNDAECICNLVLMADQEELISNQDTSINVENDPEIGIIYRKAIDKKDICLDEATGVKYLKNQLLISAFPGVDKQIIEKMAAEIQAEVVGYIELTNDYQLELLDDRTFEDLNVLSEYCMGLPYISYCSPNYSYDVTMDNNSIWEDELFTDEYRAWQKSDLMTVYYRDDALVPDEASLACMTGDNWGLKALNVPAAWEKNENASPVRVGIYDHGFASWHEDLSFEKQYNNDQSADDGSHGTHVAGIIGAKHNGIGMAGVCPNVKLYTYSFVGGDCDILADKIAFASLIGNHVKVINYSQGIATEVEYAASKGNEKARNAILNNGKIMEEFLLKVYGLGYDFLIVTTAGNTNDKRFVKADNILKFPYGYKEAEADDSSATKDVEILACYNSALNSIINPVVRNRIITVGSIGHLYHGNVLDKYNVHRCTNAGDRLDVFAPGKEILSTVPSDFPKTEVKGYALMSGTSQAAPYISGIAALMFQANPQISAREVKRILCDPDNKICTFTDGLGFEHPMPNAEICVTKAAEAPGSNQSQNEGYNGIITGQMTDLEGKGIKDMTVCVTHSGTDVESNASIFCFQTSADGTYVCSVPNGTYDILIYKEGRVPCKIYGVTVTAEEVTQLETIYVAGLEMDTYGAKLAQGKVAYSTGKGIPNVRIRLRLGWNNLTGAYVRDKSGNIIQATTDYDGKFSFYVPRGIYTIEIFKEGLDFGPRNAILMR